MADIKITLAAARVNANMTQEEVAKELNVEKRTVGNWERGKVIPKAATLYMLAHIYGLPVDAILLPNIST